MGTSGSHLSFYVHSTNSKKLFLTGIVEPPMPQIDGMTMKKTVFLFMLGIALSVGDVQAQGILGKLKNAADKVTKTIDKGKNAASGEETSSSGAQTLSEKDFPKPKGQKSNLYELMRSVNRSDLVSTINSKFANFKKTPTTKVVTLDGLNYTKLGFYYDNRAIVATAKNGTYCFDEQGNVMKHWSKNENPMRRILIGNSYIKFSSNRLIDMSNASGDAVIYDQNFNVVKKIPNVASASDYEDGVAIIVTKTVHSNTSAVSNYNHYVDINGNFVFSELTAPIDASRMTLNTHHIRPMHDGLAAFCVPMGGYKVSPWGFRDSKGKAVILAQYNEVQDFSNGLAAVCTDGKWGFIDTKGNMVIPQRYSVEPSKFDDCGMALVVNREGKYMFIDKTGNVVSKEYKRITPFCNGKALCVMDNGTPDYEHDDYTVMLDSLFNLVSIISEGILVYPNKTTCMQFYGKSALTTDNEKISRFVDGDERMGSLFIHDGHFYLHVDGCGYCLLSDTGDVMIAGLAGPFINGIAPVYDSGLHPKNLGYVNTKGEWIVKFELSEF
ncbi:MAG: WG repeat-containing protein [Bacteroidaceae bacterium]|nr:WG repeat-containing protein [Bacteroidaceae bacterium]